MRGAGAGAQNGSVAARPTGRARRLGRRIIQVVLAVAVVMLLIWALMFLRAFVLLPHAAQQEATTGLQHARENLEQLAADDADVLDAEVGAPSGTVRTISCAVGPVDQGWFVDDHLNQCTLLEMEIRQVPEGADATAGIAGELSEVEAWQGKDAFLLDTDSCEEIAGSRTAADERIPVSSPQVSLAVVRVGSLDALDECLRDPGPSARSLDAETLSDPTSTQPDVAEDAELLVVVRSLRISNSSLGCLPLPVFCQPATTTVQMPDLE